MNKFKALYQKSMLENARLIGENEKQRYNPFSKQSEYELAYQNMLIAKDCMLCANRYVWDLPINLTSQQLESLLYQWGSLCIFENDNGELTFARFTQIGDLNKYGYLDKIQPIDFAGNNYGSYRFVLQNENQDIPEGAKVCIILNDYTPLTPITSELSRLAINKSSTIKDQTSVFMQLKTNISLSIKKALALCDTEEQKNIIMQQVAQLLDPEQIIVAINAGNKNIAKDKNNLLEMFNFDNNFDTQNYCQTLDFYDKTRRAFNGIPAPDTFEKKERKITSEEENTTTHINLILIDGLLQRQNAIELFKKYCKNDKNKNITCNLQPELRQQFVIEEERDEE